MLDELPHHGGAGGAQELLQLGEVLALSERSDAEGALLGPAVGGGLGVAGLASAAGSKAAAIGDAIFNGIMDVLKNLASAATGAWSR